MDSWNIDHIVYDDYFNYELDMIETMLVKQEWRVTRGVSASRHHNSQCRTFIKHDLLEGYQCFWNDYFIEPPMYMLNVYMRMFQMGHGLFVWIHSAVEVYNDYFIQKRDSSEGSDCLPFRRWLQQLRCSHIG